MRHSHKMSARKTNLFEAIHIEDNDEGKRIILKWILRQSVVKCEKAG
jgi:hypothetical protein